MTVTVSDAFPAADAAAEPRGTAAAGPQRARVHARMRARDYGSRSVVGKVADETRVVAVQTWADLRSAWWTPDALPTVQAAWARRMPDRSRVPGENAGLYAGWVAYNHTLGLAIPAAATLVAGLLALAVWIAVHPARLALTVLITIPAVLLAVR